MNPKEDSPTLFQLKGLLCVFRICFIYLTNVLLHVCICSTCMSGAQELNLGFRATSGLNLKAIFPSLSCVCFKVCWIISLDRCLFLIYSGDYRNMTLSSYCLFPEKEKKKP